MSGYAHFWYGRLLLGTTKNAVDPDLISLFRPSDKTIVAPPFDNIPQPLHRYRQSPDYDDDLQLVYYSIRTEVVRDRLEILGYDRRTTETAFREWTREALDETNEYLEELKSSDHKFREFFRDSARREAHVLSSLTPASWIHELRAISESGLEPSYPSLDTGPHSGTLLGYMLSKEWWGFPRDEPFAALRLAMESLPEVQDIVYDLTDLVWSEYFESDDDFVKFGMTVSAEEYRSKSKTIVLTEGSTDAWILRESLHILFPHLEDYFSFLDFESTKYAGGSVNLLNTVKSFSGAGVVNNIIAMFDNDTAAHESCKTLKSATIAPNIAIVTLPEMEHLKNYPTIGPSGPVCCDINGTAASIELYLGNDVLMLANQLLTPVQWTGYNKAMKRYQGEVIDKHRLHKRFKKKLTNHSGDPGPEWDPMRAVLRAMFGAFSDRNRQRIWSFRREYEG